VGSGAASAASALDESDEDASDGASVVEESATDPSLPGAVASAFGPASALGGSGGSLSSPLHPTSVALPGATRIKAASAVRRFNRMRRLPERREGRTIRVVHVAYGKKESTIPLATSIGRPGR
jgi:hypothetical protein